MKYPGFVNTTCSDFSGNTNEQNLYHGCSHKISGQAILPFKINFNRMKFKDINVHWCYAIKLISLAIPFVFLLSVTVLQSGCSATVEDQKKEKQARLDKYKGELVELRKKIANLESELNVETSRNVVAVGLKVIERENFRHFVNVMGKVKSDQNILVSPESPGNIVSILIKEGDHVSKGQVLAQLNTEALDRSIQEVEVNLELARTLFQRQEILWKQNIGSEVQFLEAKSNKESLEKRLEGLKAQKGMGAVKSPVNGVVDELLQKRGEIAGPSIPFARVVNLDNIYVTADVSESFLTNIKKGDQVEIEFPIIEKTITASIDRTSSVIDADSRTFRIRVDLKNTDRLIRPNLMAVLKLCTYQNKEAIVVPSLIIKKDFTGEFLFIAVEEEGKLLARKKYIETGLKDNSVILVNKGLEPGMQIITEGFAQVVDGTQLQVK